MNLNGKNVLVCDCEGTMSIDGKALSKACGGEGALDVATHLCRRQITAFQKAAQDAAGEDTPLLVACTQEAPLFLETLNDMEDAANAADNIQFTNIRERAGWSDAANDKGAKTNLTAKMAALLNAAARDAEPSRSVTMSSEGVALVLGRGEDAIEAARKLGSRLDVTVIIEGGSELIPPALVEVPIFTGKVAGAGGHLGAFQVRVENFMPAKASSKDTLTWEGAPQAGTSECDLILDLRGAAPLFPHADKRDGYFNPDPANPALVAEALFDMTDLVGEFEKPRYVDYDATICAHSRSRITGCSRCIDICPAGAITPANDKVSIDPYVCGGCGLCASVCPTGAAQYALPRGDSLLQGLRTLMSTYQDAGGTAPVLLVHDQEHGQQTIDMMARLGRGLPANVLPFTVNEVTQLGLDFVFSAAAFGAAKTLFLLPPQKRGEAQGLEDNQEIAEAVFDALGYGAERVAVVHADDPSQVEETLWSLGTPAAMPRGDFLPMGKKRAVMRLALDTLHQNAQTPVDEVALPAGAPFGAVDINVDGCTLCLACVGACPAGALRDNPDKPQLSFTEDACVQCGLCRNTCPEKVISLTPRLSFKDDAKSAALVKEQEPFHCVRCGKPYGARASIERMLDKLSGHTMFQGDALTRIKMCDDCRVVDMFDESHPLAGAPRPNPRTTDDYLREREEMRRQAAADMQAKGLKPEDDS